MKTRVRKAVGFLSRNGKRENNISSSWAICFRKVIIISSPLTRFVKGKILNQIHWSFIIRWLLPFEMATLSICRWRVDPGRFHLRPGLHLDSDHLHSDTSQSSINYFRLRHSGSSDIQLFVKKAGTPDTIISASSR
jgi:hypothetical protein